MKVFIATLAALLVLTIAPSASAAQRVVLHSGGSSTTLLYVSTTSIQGLYAADINAVVVPAIQRVESIGGHYSCIPTYTVLPVPTPKHRTDIQRAARITFVGQTAVVTARRGAPRGERSWSVEARCADLTVDETFTIGVRRN